MLLEWNVIMEAEKEKCATLSEHEKFAYFLLLQYRNPYRWGKENMNSADCSGSVCLSLMMATGCKIRTTANGLYKKFFIKKNPKKDDIQCVFFVSRYDRKHGDRIAKKGEAVHVAGIVGEQVAFNSVQPHAELRTVGDLRQEYEFTGCDCIVRGLDRNILQRASDEGTDLFGLDEELQLLFQMEN